MTYQCERYFVWAGLEGGRLSIPALSDGEILRQVELLVKRGFRDWIHVEMVVEVEVEPCEEGEWDEGDEGDDEDGEDGEA